MKRKMKFENNDILKNTMWMVFTAIMALLPLMVFSAEQENFVQARIIEGPASGDFSKAGDEDWWMFYASSGVSYVIVASNLQARCDAAIELYGPDGKTLIKFENKYKIGGTERLEWTCRQDNLYYVKLQPGNPDAFGHDTGYEIKIESDIFLTSGYDRYENNDVPAKARPFILGDKQRHGFHHDQDRDWIRFHAVPSMAYAIEATSLTPGCSLVMEIYDKDANTLLTAKTFDGADNQTPLNWPDNATLDIHPEIRKGHYYAKIMPANNGAACIGAMYEIWLHHAAGAFDVRVMGQAICAGDPVYSPDIWFVAENNKDYPADIINPDQGVYQILLEAGVYLLIAKKDGFETFEKEIEIASLEPIQSVIEMTPSGWYKDMDGDGYSDGKLDAQSCKRPARYFAESELTAISGDCNDHDSQEHPGQTWHKDEDNDGYTDGQTLTQCSRPKGYKLEHELVSDDPDPYDFRIDLSFALEALKILTADKLPCQLDKLDVDQNHKVDLVDAVIFLRLLSDVRP